jgi:hypothetical protein
MRKRVEFIESGNWEGLAKVKKEVDALYDRSSDKWYAELRSRWSPDESDEPVSCTSINIQLSLMF